MTSTFHELGECIVRMRHFSTERENFRSASFPHFRHFMITAFKPTESLRMVGWFFLELF